MLGGFGFGFGFGGSFLGIGTNNLLNAERNSAASGGTDKGEAEEGNTGNGSLHDGGKEAVKAMRLLARFRHDGFIAGEDVGLVRVEVVSEKEQPEDVRPRK